MIDFTAYRHPVLAVRCPICGRRAGVMGRQPSGHKAFAFHARRKADADRRFIEQHGADAGLARMENGWRIDPEGRTRSGQSS